MTPVVWVALVVGILASVQDLARRHVSDWFPAIAGAAGLFLHISEQGWRGLGDSLLGAVAGFLVFFIFFWLGGMGGGDIKLMTGFGALLGSNRLLWAAFWAAVVGGLIAAAVLGVRAILVRFGVRRSAVGEARFIPYAPAITLGVWLSLISAG